MCLIKNEKFEYPSYAWPGGYGIIYYTADGGTLCPDCANGKNGSLATDDPEKQDARSGWLLVSSDIYWQGPTINCDHCGKEIESAYGYVEESECGNN